MRLMSKEELIGELELESSEGKFKNLTESYCEKLVKNIDSFKTF